jgi:hypothetical protein
MIRLVPIGCDAVIRRNQNTPCLSATQLGAGTALRAAARKSEFPFDLARKDTTRSPFAIAAAVDRIRHVFATVSKHGSLCLR